MKKKSYVGACALDCLISLGGYKKDPTINVGPFSGGVLKSQIQPERSAHSPTEVKETVNLMLREKN